ncbi:MAG: hypothetical protein HYX55_08435 [Chloroflexi bacterium]|nr:hypothetical protein [Chloroflexota bacterium]
MTLLAAPTSVLAQSYGGCQNTFMEHWFTYTEKSSSSTNVRNVNANIGAPSITDQFRPCNWSYDWNGTSAWVAIVPGSGNPQNGNAEAILQIGVDACADYPESACQSGQKRYFWAESGCGLSVPDGQDLGGPVNTAAHNFVIRHFSDNWYNLNIDGITKVAFLMTTHDDIKCWIGSNYTKAQYAFERWDRGDGIGAGAPYANITSAKLMWGDPGDSGTWANAGFTFCSAAPSSGVGVSHCTMFSTSITAWTTY